MPAKPTAAKQPLRALIPFIPSSTDCPYPYSKTSFAISSDEAISAEYDLPDIAILQASSSKAKGYAQEHQEKTDAELARAPAGTEAEGGSILGLGGVDGGDTLSNANEGDDEHETLNVAELHHGSVSSVPTPDATWPGWVYLHKGGNAKTVSRDCVERADKPSSNMNLRTIYNWLHSGQ